MELFLLAKDPGSSFARGIDIEALRDLSRVQNRADFLRMKELAAPAPTVSMSVADIVNLVFNQNPPNYDIVNGAAHYIDLNPDFNNITFHFSNWYNAMATTPTAVCNCYDAASAVQYYLRLNGVPDAEWAYMNPFGYLRQTNLIGRGQCNNPFYGNPSSNPNPVCDPTDPTRSAFANHAFCVVPESGDVAECMCRPAYRH